MIQIENQANESPANKIEMIKDLERIASSNNVKKKAISNLVDYSSIINKNGEKLVYNVLYSGKNDQKAQV
jgi:hypothetical protein